jgi:hypothetical protein
MSGPFELLGDPDAGVCEDGLCAVPAPPPAAEVRPHPEEDAEPGYADGSPGIL